MNKSTISVSLSGMDTLQGALKKCGDAIREQETALLASLRRPKDDFVGASRLVRLSENEAIYEVWLRPKQVSNV